MSDPFLILRPQWNTPGKSDMSSVFKPGAEQALSFWPGSRLVVFDNRLPAAARRRSIIEQAAPDAGKPWRGIFYYGHGTKLTLPSAAFSTANIGSLLAVAAPMLPIKPLPADERAFAVVFQACTTGAGVGADGGMCDATRDELCALGYTEARTEGHTGSGHADKNPNNVFSDGEGSPVGCGGGRWVLCPRARPLWAEHVHALESIAEYRCWFAVQSVRVILAWLATPRDRRPALTPSCSWYA